MERSQNGETAIFSLSLSQQNIWALEQTCPGTSINHISTTLRIRGRVDLALLQESISMVIAADPSLRVRIVLENGVPMRPFNRNSFRSMILPRPVPTAFPAGKRV